VSGEGPVVSGVIVMSCSGGSSGVDRLERGVYEASLPRLTAHELRSERHSPPPPPSPPEDTHRASYYLLAFKLQKKSNTRAHKKQQKTQRVCVCVTHFGFHHIQGRRSSIQ